MNDATRPIEQMLDAYAKAVFARDLDAFLDLYREDVQVFDTWAIWSYSGIQAWRKMIEHWFGSLGTERVKVTFDGVRILTSQQLAVLYATVTYAGMSAEGVELRSMQNRLTWTLTQLHGSWKVAHEHTSAPVDSDGKAILLRDGAT